MKTNIYSLIVEKWIPVVLKGGQSRFCNLIEAFTNPEIIDLRGKPYEKISLYRLLICIAQAALDGPEDEDSDVTEVFAKSVTEYLEKWKGRFNLFDRERPFLQFADLQPKGEPTNADKLDFALAAGGNSTFFDHYALAEERNFPPHRLALMLLSYLCFSPGGLLPEAEYQGTLTKKAGNKDAPAVASSSLHTFCRRSSLKDTVQANLVSKFLMRSFVKRAWGRPVWELFPKSRNDQEALHNATLSYLGRLVPLSRLILLNPDGKSVVLAGEGFTCPDYSETQTPEPSATTILKKDGKGRTLLRGNSDKAIWRELPALTIKTKSLDDNQCPHTLQEIDKAKGMDIWCGSLIINKANILDSYESVAHIPAQLWQDGGRRLYEKEVAHADDFARRLGKAVYIYKATLKSENAGGFSHAFSNHYWTAVENNLWQLHKAVECLNDNKELCERYLFAWEKSVRQTARKTYDRVCFPQTPRQFQAHAEGLLAFRSKPKK